MRPRLHALFVNGLGWRQRCAECSAPPAGPAWAYLGPYPITAAVAAQAAGNENARVYGLPGGASGR